MEECARRNVKHVYLSAMLHLARYFVINKFDLLDINGEETKLPSDHFFLRKYVISFARSSFNPAIYQIMY